MAALTRLSRRRWLGGKCTKQTSPSTAPGSTDLLRARRSAMGSFFDVRLPVGLPGALDLATRALDLIDLLEDQLTVYRDHSEVSVVNRTAHQAPVAVEVGLFNLLDQARRIHEMTEGAYDVTAGALSVAWGFFQGPRRVPDPETLAEARARTGQHLVHLDPVARTVSFDRPGILINLGSIGKGHALDRAAELIHAHWWPTGALLHGGQSSVLAVGSPPWQFGGRWEVALRNPFHPERPLGTFRLRDRAMGTSGATFQQFEANGRLFGHIIDPRTGEPPQVGPASVSVLAPTAAEADALSTAFYLLGPAKTAACLANRPDVAALFVLEPAGDERPRAIPIHLTDDDFVADRRLKVLPPFSREVGPGDRPQP